MGSYYQNRIIQTNCDNAEPVTFMPSASKFLDGQKLANTEHFGLYRFIEARTNPAYGYNTTDKGCRMVKIYTICDYDTPENSECHWQELTAEDKFSQRYFALDNLAEYDHLKGFVVCPKAEQYFDFGKLIKANIDHILTAPTNEHGYRTSLLSPLAILTRQHLYSGGGGDYGFHLEPSEVKALVGLWRGKPIWWQNDPPKGLIDITSHLMVFK